MYVYASLSIMTTTLEMGKQRLRDINCLVQGHSAGASGERIPAVSDFRGKVHDL